jgi:hypothetical protein
VAFLYPFVSRTRISQKIIIKATIKYGHHIEMSFANYLGEQPLLSKEKRENGN